MTTLISKGKSRQGRLLFRGNCTTLIPVVDKIALFIGAANNLKYAQIHLKKRCLSPMGQFLVQKLVYYKLFVGPIKNNNKLSNVPCPAFAEKEAGRKLSCC